MAGERLLFQVQVPVMPIRSEARDASEMVTQGLAGERVEWLESGEKDWVRVRCDWDGYEGWCDKKQLFEFADNQPVDEVWLAPNLTRFTRLSDGAVLWYSMGSRLAVADGGEHCRCGEWLLRPLDSVGQTLGREDAASVALRLLGVPYLWGGRSAFGVDCSGLVQLAWSAMGVALPRDASQQWGVGQEVGVGERGDLAFFSNDNGAIVHVGILLSPDEILHAAGEVRRDRFSAEGIQHAQSGTLTHRLAGIRRLR